MFNQIFDAIEEWMRELLTGMISSTWTVCLRMSIRRQVRLRARLDRRHKDGMAVSLV